MFDAVRPGLHIVIGSVYAISALNMYWTKLILGLLVDKLFKKSSGYDCNYETFSKKSVDSQKAELGNSSKPETEGKQLAKKL